MFSFSEVYVILGVAFGGVLLLNAMDTYAPDNAWFIQTMNAVFSVGGDVMHPDISNNFLRLLAEG